MTYRDYFIDDGMLRLLC